MDEPKPGTMQHLEQRNEYLEDLVRWHGFALDLLASIQEAHGDPRVAREPHRILDGTFEQLARILDWEVVAFMIVSERDQNFVMSRCYPDEHRDFLQIEVDQLIENGQFAWAINQNRELVLPAHGWDCNLVLHVLATRSRIRGMFVGLPIGNQELSETALRLLSIILHQTSYALESAALYELVKAHNANLEKTISDRTQQLAHQYRHDQLTGLPNRMHLLERMNQAIDYSVKNRTRVAALAFDLDLFKRVNEVLGYAGGDQLLKTVGQRIGATLGKQSVMERLGGDFNQITVARVGADEYFVVLADAKSVDVVVGVADQIMAAIAKPFKIQGDEIYITTSIGISMYPDDGETSEQILSQADVALYTAKQQGRHRFVFYNKEMNARAKRDMQTIGQLRNGFARNEFRLFYEPQVDFFTQEVVSLEASIRWIQAPDRILLPAQFMPIAEETGFAIQLGEWALRTACAEIAGLQAAGVSKPTFSLNIPGKQFALRETMELVSQVLEENGLSASQLQLELSEEAVMRDIAYTQEALDLLQDIGVGVLIDDFGSGSSSLSYLKRLPLKGLKIGEAFVQDLASDSNDLAVVKAVISVAHNLGLRVVALGVDIEPQREILEQLGCDRGQGFFFGQPMSVDEIKNFLLSRSA